MYFADLFKLIQIEDYKTTGDCVDYCIKTYEGSSMIRLMFQCSNGVEDWKNNFNFPKKPYKQAKNILWYHGGYCKAWKSANDTIMEELIVELSKHPSYTVEISGWSLGGAMAVMAAEDFNFRTGEFVQLVTYGAPKVIWGHWTKRRVKESCAGIYQFANINDLVPCQPPFPGYYHANKIKVGDEKWSLKKWLNPEVYHCLYGDPAIYRGFLETITI